MPPSAWLLIAPDRVGLGEVGILAESNGTDIADRDRKHGALPLNTVLWLRTRSPLKQLATQGADTTNTRTGEVRWIYAHTSSPVTVIEDFSGHQIFGDNCQELGQIGDIIVTFLFTWLAGKFLACVFAMFKAKRNYDRLTTVMSFNFKWLQII